MIRQIRRHSRISDNQLSKIGRRRKVSYNLLSQMARHRVFDHQQAMRIHVKLPAPTTVSVDDDLMALLGAVLVMEHPPSHADAKKQLGHARSFVKSVAARYRAETQDGLSRFVQREVFRRIADPRALAIFDARDTEEAKSRADAAHLAECALKGWLTPAQIAEKKRQKELKAEWRKKMKCRNAMKEMFRLREESAIRPKLGRIPNLGKS